MTLLDYMASRADCAPTIPVIALEDVDKAVPLARACAAGGIRILEVTLRTSAGLEAMRRIAAQVSDVLVGAGTVTRRDELKQVLDAGARFAFSPGYDPVLVDEANKLGIEYIPAVMTPSEVMSALNQGVKLMKLFPVEQAGGIGMLKALYGPFPTARFCPTGGVNAANAASFLAQPNVVAVGGAWTVPKAAIDAGDWAAITALAAASLKLRR